MSRALGHQYQCLTFKNDFITDQTRGLQLNTPTVTIDGGEIHEHQWLRPRAALNQQGAGAVKLAAPTFALTTRLAEFPDVDAALSTIATWPEERLLGHLHDVEGGSVALYHQDVAYESGRLNRDGPRHRLWMVESGWRYERAF